jgi:hypothetical protein
LDDTARRILRELGRAMAEAISDSSEAGAALRRLREEGYSLYLLVDRTEGGRARDAEPVAAPSPSYAGLREPAFRINASDLFFLRSIGIDPRRRVR